MVSRIVSLVLIATVIACPMWCGDGVCLIAQCCLLSEADVGDVHAAAQCCCDKPTNRNENNRKPVNSSDESCQGICGGAVIKKTDEIDYDSRVVYLPLVDCDTRTTLRFSVSENARNEQHFRGSASNFGRSLRALHMSFLC